MKCGENGCCIHGTCLGNDVNNSINLIFSFGCYCIFKKEKIFISTRFLLFLPIIHRNGKIKVNGLNILDQIINKSDVRE